MIKFALIFSFIACGLFGQRAKGERPPTFDSRPIPKYTYPDKTDKDLAKLFKVKPWNTSKLLCFDTRYIGVDFRYFTEYAAWFNKFRDKYFPTHKSQAFDCDNFAFLYKDLMISSVFKKDSKRQILVGVLVVNSEKEFHGIGGEGLHALNIIHTNAGWYVIEPQNGKYTQLEKYTNPIVKYIF